MCKTQLCFKKIDEGMRENYAFHSFYERNSLCQQKHKPSRNKGTIHLLPKNFIKRSFAKVCTHDITRKTNLSQMTQPIDRGLLLFFTMPHPRVFTFLVQAPYILHTFSSVSTQHARQTRCHHWLAFSENANKLKVFSYFYKTFFIN